MKATTIRMEEMMLARIDSMAKDINRSRTWLINQAVERFRCLLFLLLLLFFIVGSSTGFGADKSC